MSALTEKVAREHWSYRWRNYVVCKGCKDRAIARTLQEAEDWWRLHIAAVTEAATRDAVAAEIRDRLNTADLIRLADTYSGYYQGVRAGYQDAIEIVGGKP